MWGVHNSFLSLNWLPNLYLIKMTFLSLPLRFYHYFSYSLGINKIWWRLCDFSYRDRFSCCESNCHIISSISICLFFISSIWKFIAASRSSAHVSPQLAPIFALFPLFEVSIIVDLMFHSHPQVFEIIFYSLVCSSRPQI